MSKQNFHTLLSRYRNGNCTEREKRLVEQWFALLDKETPVRPPAEDMLLEEKMWQAIQEQTPSERRRLPPVWRWAAAAVLLLAFGWVTYRLQLPVSAILPSPLPTTASSVDLTTKTNTSGTIEQLLLPDGTEIQLSPKSSVEYPAVFTATKREVRLKGKAFFKVTKDSQRPFFVYTSGITTKVLGTSFWIDERPHNSAVEVSVVTGKVSVSQASPIPESGNIKRGVILTANQRVKFNLENQAFETGLVALPVLVTPDEAETSAVAPVFVFEDTPLPNVIQSLENAYGIEIILENDLLKSCLFTADITHQPLFTKLDLLCSSVNATYEVRGTRILISGSGCQTH